MKNPQVLIRKYSDRRLYDSAASRYVKLQDIARMVREGVEVRVVDDRTGKDITDLIFTQIIVENAREKEIALPMQLLTQLVRTSDKATHDFLTWYLDSTMDIYKKAQDTVHTRFADAKRAASSPLDFVRDLLSQYAETVPVPQGEAPERHFRRGGKTGSHPEKRRKSPQRVPKRKGSKERPK